MSFRLLIEEKRRDQKCYVGSGLLVMGVDAATFDLGLLVWFGMGAFAVRFSVPSVRAFRAHHEGHERSDHDLPSFAPYTIPTPAPHHTDQSHHIVSRSSALRPAYLF